MNVFFFFLFCYNIDFIPVTYVCVYMNSVTFTIIIIIMKFFLPIYILFKFVCV